MHTSCTDFASQITDPELKTFVQNLASQHQSCFTKFYELLNKNA